MRWEELFADIEARLEEADRSAALAEVPDRTRRDLAATTLADRLRAATGSRVRLLVDDERITGRVAEVGPDWLLLEEDPPGACLLPLCAVAVVEGLGRGVAPQRGVVASRLGLPWALRGLARDRVPVRVLVRGGSVLVGTVDRVGADHVDLALHPQDEPRRAGAVRGVATLPLAAVRAVRSAAPVEAGYS